MDNNKRPTTPETVWKSIDEKEEARMGITFTPDQLCAMARSRERESAWSRGFLLALLSGLALVFAYNFLSVSQFWIKLSQGWLFVWTCLLFWRCRWPSRRRGTDETCANFLRRQFEDKHKGLLEVRRFTFLLIPPILVTWWAGKALRLGRLKALGIDPSSRLYEFVNGPWLFIVIGLLLALIWVAFTLAAKKATRELEEVIRRSGE